MKRQPSGELVADSGTGEPGDDSTAATRVFASLLAATESARRTLSWLAARAVDRSLSPGSLAGSSVLLAVCAAAWFSGGGREHEAWGLLAMAGWLMFVLAARGLAGFKARGPVRPAGRASSDDGPADAGTDWLVLPAVTWADNAPSGSGAGSAGRGASRSASGWSAADEEDSFEVGESAAEAAAEAGALSFGWLAAVCGMAGECAIYGGMAAGIGHTTLLGAWSLAALTVSVVAITDMFGACRSAVLTAERRKALGRNPVLRTAAALLRVHPALRGFIAFCGYAVGGPEAALFSVCGIQAVAVVATIVTFVRVNPAAGAARRAAQTRGPPAARSAQTSRLTSASAGTTITAFVGMTGSPGETTSVRYATTPPAAWTVAGRAAEPAGGQGAETAGSAAGTERPDAGAVTGAASQARAPTAEGRAMIVALRDDGAAARWAGRLVQGNLIPLPPALAGLIATGLLAGLGLRHLPAFIALTPPVVMMLAAPGSSHPHDRRLHWLVPVLLAAAQFAYVAPLGFALALPGPIVFSLCAILAIWYVSNTALVTGNQSTRPDEDAGAATESEPRLVPASWVGWGAGLGWETRMFVIGLTTTFGLATFGYLGLAAYLGVLICREVMTGYLVFREEDRQ
ncbi:MAG: hypothetical protein LBV34_00465 [Nocardiopsaceae bacterium]|jgi:hypothetical protein|nr:hypothetical protein [Nocardiopsaceae bacterium]